MDSVAHLGADQALVSEVVAAGDELVPEPALSGLADDGAHVERADLVEGGRRGEQRRLGLRSEDEGLGPALLSTTSLASLTFSLSLCVSDTSSARFSR